MMSLRNLRRGGTGGLYPAAIVATHHGASRKKKFWTRAGIGAAVWVVACIVAFCVWKFVLQPKRRKRKFEQNTNKAKEEVKSKTKQQQQKQHGAEYQRPYSGVYTAKFEINYRARSKQEAEKRRNDNQVVMRLNFTDNGIDGYIISGVAKNIKGESSIEDGYLNYYGDAYWIEKYMTGRYGNQNILSMSQGKFNFVSILSNNNTNQNIFKGTWVTSHEINGKYVGFQQATNEQTATMEPIPVVIATPSNDNNTTTPFASASIMKGDDDNNEYRKSNNFHKNNNNINESPIMVQGVKRIK